MSIIGNNIRALREREGLTQQELADALQVSRETVNKWESGVIEALREHNIELLRSRYALTVDDLRSETRGLAAQMRGRNGATTVPLMRLEGDQTSTQRQVPLADIAWQSHRNAFALEMDSSMDRVLPTGCLAFADPQLKPTDGSIVVAELGETDAHLVVRRIRFGAHKAMLTAEAHEDVYDDLILNAKDLRLRGTVFWYQPKHELS